MSADPSETARYVRRALIKAYEKDLGRELDPKTKALLELIGPAAPSRTKRRSWWRLF